MGRAALVVIAAWGPLALAQPADPQGDPQPLAGPTVVDQREATLGDAPSDVSLLSEQLATLAQQLEEELARQNLAAGRVALKVRYADQGAVTRSETLGRPTAEASQLHEVALRLIARTHAEARPVRGLGVQLTNLTPSTDVDRQLDLFRTS